MDMQHSPYPTETVESGIVLKRDKLDPHPAETAEWNLTLKAR